METKSVAIVTDAYSGITKHDITGTNIFILQLPLLLNGEPSDDIENISFSKFDKYINEKVKISVGEQTEDSIKELWNHLLKIKQYDYILHITYSSELNDMYYLCSTLSKNFDGKVFVVNSKRISVAQRSMVHWAKKMIKSGMPVDQVASILSDGADEFSLYFMSTNAKYIKKNCKLCMTKGAKDVLGYTRPVFELKNGVIDVKKKSNNFKKSVKILIKSLEHDLKTRFKQLVENGEIEIFIAYSCEIEESILLKEYFVKKHPNINICYTDQIPISLCANLGLGILMLGCGKIFK